jgi:hypothetical protein
MTRGLGGAIGVACYFACTIEQVLIGAMFGSAQPVLLAFPAERYVTRLMSHAAYVTWNTSYVIRHVTRHT